MLVTVWIDYKKAYDSMPYTWILESLELYKINRTLKAFIQSSMGRWKTNLENNFRLPAEVTIMCCIYQCPYCCSA